MSRRGTRSMWPQRLAGAVAFGVAGVLVAGMMTAAHAEEAKPTRIIVDDSRQGRPQVSKLMTGAEVSELGSGYRTLWRNGKPVRSAKNRVKDLGIKTLRFLPFGLYQWEKAFEKSRPCQPMTWNKDGRGVLGGSRRFGIREFMQFATAAEVKPVVVIQMGRTTTRSAANLVEYLRAPAGTNPNSGTAWATFRKRDGHPAPYPLTAVEIGNEPDRPKTSLWRSKNPRIGLRQYVRGGTAKQKNWDVLDIPNKKGGACRWGEAGSRGDGTKDQKYSVYYGPVRRGSMRLTVDGRRWKQVQNLEQQGRGEHVFVLNAKRGIVRFGDGRHGGRPKGDIRVTYTSKKRPGFLDYQKAIRKIDRKTDVCATWAPVYDKRDGVKYRSFPWFMKKKQHQPGAYDCVTMHPYTNFSKDFAPPKRWKHTREGHDDHFLGASKASTMLKKQMDSVRRLGTAKRRQVAVTEYGALPFAGFKTKKFPHVLNSLTNGLYVSSQLAQFSQFGIPYVEGGALMDSTRGVLTANPKTTTVHALIRQQLRPVFGHRGWTPKVRFKHNPRIAPLRPDKHHAKTYAALTATATRGNDGRLRVAVINRHPHKAVEATVAPNGFNHKRSVRFTRIASAKYSNYNPRNNIRIKHGHITTKSTRRFRHTFPAHSVTVLTLKRTN